MRTNRISNQTFGAKTQITGFNKLNFAEKFSMYRVQQKLKKVGSQKDLFDISIQKSNSIKVLTVRLKDLKKNLFVKKPVQLKFYSLSNSKKVFESIQKAFKVIKKTNIL